MCSSHAAPAPAERPGHPDQDAGPPAGGHRVRTRAGRRQVHRLRNGQHSLSVQQ